MTPYFKEQLGRAALSAAQPAQVAQPDAASEAFRAMADGAPVDAGWSKSVQSAYAWAVSGLPTPFYGPHAESDARAEARRCGGTAEAFPLFKGAQSESPMYLSKKLRDFKEQAEADRVTQPESDDRAMLEIIDERDRCHEWADKLAEAIASHTGFAIGEHSSANNPWSVALEALESHECEQTAKQAAQGAGEVWGWAVVDARGNAQYTRVAKEDRFTENDIKRYENGLPQYAPMRVVTLYTRPTPAKPVSSSLPSGWVPLTITYEGQYPEEVAYGPQVMMDRLGKWLGRYFEWRLKAPAQPAPVVPDVQREIAAALALFPADLPGQTFRVGGYNNGQALEADNDTQFFSKKRVIALLEKLRGHLTAATTPTPPAQAAKSAFTKALEIRTAQGWELTGEAIPVLYTDTINDQQVMRDDVWLCTTDALKPAQAAAEAGMYLLQDTRSYVGNCVVWWAKDGNGYTTDVAKAHRYTFDEAMRQHRSRETDSPWLCDEVVPLARGRVDMQDVHKLRSLTDQRAAIAAALATHQQRQDGGEG